MVVQTTFLLCGLRMIVYAHNAFIQLHLLLHSCNMYIVHMVTLSWILKKHLNTVWPGSHYNSRYILLCLGIINFAQFSPVVYPNIHYFQTLTMTSINTCTWAITFCSHTPSTPSSYCAWSTYSTKWMSQHNYSGQCQSSQFLCHISHVMASCMFQQHPWTSRQLQHNYLLNSGNKLQGRNSHRFQHEPTST